MKKIPIASMSGEFERLAQQMWSMMDQVTARRHFRCYAPRAWQPRLNIYESADRFLICAELAGMVREQIEVFVDSGRLHIRGNRTKPQPESMPDDVGVVLMEIDSGRFHRAIDLPADILADNISAYYDLGYLWIMLPRRPFDVAATIES